MLLRILFCILCVLGLTFGQGLQLVPSESVKDGQVSDQDLLVNSEKFIPTHRWQVIKEGQAVPSGLHYRMNMETGKKEARLLATAGSATGDAIDIKAVKKALKDTKEPRPSDLDEPQLSEERKRRVAELRAAQRPMEALKADLADADLSLMSDGEIIKNLLAEYRKPAAQGHRQLAILRDLEYYVHQIDNALSFVDYGGMGLLKSALNNSSPEHRELAAYVAGSAAQSNPGVQRAALEYGLMHAICAVLPGEASPAVRRKLVFALSAVLRNFPAAQTKFLELGGPSIFPASATTKERVKVVTLLIDLVQERRIAEELGESGAVQTKDEIRQMDEYKKVAVTARLVDSGWCERIPELLGLPDWDSQEKVLRAMEELAPACPFAAARPALRDLRGRYAGELAADADNDYLEGLLGTVDALLAATAKAQEL